MITRPSAFGAVVWVDGPDGESFLQGLLSNDVAGLETGRSRQALLLDATGHIQVVLRVVRSAPQGFTLVTDAAQGAVLADLLERYHFSEDLEIVGPEPVDIVTFTGGEIAGADMIIDSPITGALDAIGAASAMTASTGTAVLDPESFEAARIAIGIPRFGVDIGPRTLVHEAGLHRSAVSFDKGCYLGQETVARVEHRGGVRRRLVALALPGLVDAGVDVAKDGRTVGTLTSTVVHPNHGPIGLATLRFEATDGDDVDVAGLDAPATVVDLPFDSASPT